MISSNYVSITQKLAPTAEHAKLLKEYEKEAKEKVISSVRDVDNKLNCVVFHQEDFINDQQHFKVIYDLNGERYTCTSIMNNPLNIDKIADKVSEDLAAHIASVVTHKVVSSLVKKFILRKS